MSVLPPGRFLMPGDLEGSPALTFAPLDLPQDAERKSGSLWSMMRRRFEAYKDVVVRPFFVDHFQRLDRQIVLVDALAAFNAGPHAVQDLESALTDILGCFQVGRRTLLSAIFNPRADKVLFAATKADHLHHSSHDRLEAILRRMVDRAVTRAEFSGADIDVVALAAVRATREATVKRNGESLPSIAGAAAAGEKAGGKVFDGQTEVVVFPGDLPADPDSLFKAEDKARAHSADEADLRFLRFRPPFLETTLEGVPALPHIRFDRALQFLIGDRLQ
jgi:predicted YcjX-like family ATPase